MICLGHEAALRPSGWRTLAEELAASTGSRVAIVSRIDRVHPDRSFIVSGGIRDGFDELLSARLHDRDDDSYCAATRGSTPGTVHLSDEILSPAARLNHPGYASLCEPWSLEHFLSGCICASGDSSAFLILGRTSDAARFLETDKEFVRTKLLPSLRFSLRVSQHVQALHRENTLLAAILDTAPDGFVAFDGHGHVTAINRQASDILAEHDGLDVINDCLRATTSGAQEQLETGLAVALGHSGPDPPPPSIALIPRDSGRQPYKVVISALPLPAEGPEGPGSRAAMAMIHRRWSDADQALSTVLHDTYGLTQSEIRLCDAVLGGQTLSEASASLQISRNTAKTHLRHIFDKTGLRSQASLVRFLAFGGKRA